MTKSVFARALFTCGLALCVSPAWAWGPAGHRIVAMIAEARLTPAVRARVSQLLLNGQYTMADVSSCPDALRAAERGNFRTDEQYCVTIAGAVPADSGPWHYIDIPLPAPATHSLEAYCPNHACVVDKIKSFADALRGSSDETERRAALMYLIHFVGDIHQPLHCVERKCDQGGNQEHVNFYVKNHELVDRRLHGVWDSDLVDKAMADAHITEDRLYASALLERLKENDAAKWAQTPIEEVAWEGWTIAERHVYRGIPEQNFCGLTGPPGQVKLTDLSSDYEKEGVNIVREQLLKAGVRLAALLETALAQ